MFEHGKSPRVQIAGAGPAALALAAELAERGVPVRLVAPEPFGPWEASYGCFEASARGLGLESAVLSRIASPSVFGSEGALELPLSYFRLDTPRLQTALLSRAKAAGCEFESGVVDGSATSAPDTLLIDATGRRGFLSDSGSATHYQTAYGVWLDVPSEQLPPSSLMDFRECSAEDGGAPSFLYALVESDDGARARLFVQETVLVSDQPASFEVLKSRLHARLDAMQLSGFPAQGEEHCLIPMGGKLPSSRTSALPYGAAAGMTHPATGYQLTTALSRAPEVAAAIAHGLESDVRTAQRMAYDALWPTERRRAYALYCWGAEVLSGFNLKDMQHFVDAFFDLPAEDWLAFMEGRLKAPQILSLMWKVFRRARPGLRAQLLLRSSLAGSMALRAVAA